MSKYFLCSAPAHTEWWLVLGVIICNLYPIMDYGLANTPVWTLAAQLPSQVFISSFSSCGEKEGEHTITFLAIFSAAGAAVRGPTQTRSSSVSLTANVITSASKSSIRRFVITEKAPTRAFSWLKAPTSAFTFKTLLRHYGKWAL